MHLQFPRPISVAAIGHADPVQRHPVVQTESGWKKFPAKLAENSNTETKPFEKSTGKDADVQSQRM